MKGKWLTDKQRRWLIVGVYAMLIFVGVMYYLLITKTPFENPCRYYEETGKLCGGCGATRMMLSLIELDIPKAFGYNPVAFVILCIWNVIGIGAFIGKPKFLTNPWFLSPITIITLLSMLFFTFLRG